MENPNRSRITVIAPFKPLCVPLDVDQSFANEIFDRRAQRIAAPWERLGLVYLAEHAAAPERSKSDILVNNLTQQIIFRVFLTNRSRKLVEWDQAGFALLKKIFRKITKARESAARRWEAVRSRGMGGGAIEPKELHTVLKVLLKQTEENERSGNLSGISEEKLKRTLTKVLRGISERTRTNFSSDIRITKQRKALLKLLTVKYADWLSKEPVVSAAQGKSVFGTVLPFVNPQNVFSTNQPESAAKRYWETEARPIYGKEELFRERTREVSLLRGSLGSRLDSRTLEELDKIVKRAYSVNPAKTQSGAVLRTVENSEHTVMLIPPAQTDGVRANDDYARQLPPIEYKRDQPREQAEPMSPKRSRVINRRQTQTGTPAITGRLENFSREEINRLADKIYAQIETRVLRERRRAGM